MSVQATTAVWLYSKSSGADLIVMLAIADAANSDGSNAYPGMPRLMEYTRKQKSAVSESIVRCIERGELRRDQKAHRDKAAIYSILLPTLSTYEQQQEIKAPGSRSLSEERKGPVFDEKGSGFSGERVRFSESSPSIQLQQQEPTYIPNFEDFWKKYPTRHGKKVGKANAQIQWNKLSPTNRVLAFESVDNYADACERGLSIAKDAFRWLRDRLYEDWDTPARPDSWAGPRDRFLEAGQSALEALRRGREGERARTGSVGAFDDEVDRSLPPG